MQHRSSQPSVARAEPFPWHACRWAYEHKNEEAIELLQAAGIDEQAKDRGKAPRHVPRAFPPRAATKALCPLTLGARGALNTDGKTAAEVGAETPGQLTKWAEALRKKQEEEAAKRAAEMAEAQKNAAAAGDDDWDDDWDDAEEDEEDWEEYDEL